MHVFWNRYAGQGSAPILAQLHAWLRRPGADRPAEPEDTWLGWDGWVCTDCHR